MLRSRLLQTAGFTITELTVAMGIISVLSGLAAMSAGPLIDRYKAETMVRTVHADLLQARVTAMQKNRQYFFVVKDGSPAAYQLYEDTNDSGGIRPDDGDQGVWPSPRPLEYAPNWSGSLILDPRGIVKTDTNSLTNSLSLSFATGAADPEYDCLQVNAMRIKMGKMKGSSCEPR